MNTTARIDLIDLGRQHRAIAAELDAAIDRCRRRSSFTLGEDVESFEAEFAAFCGTRYAVGVNSGTDALHFALRAVGVGEGDEVITAVNTFTATAEAILMCGARPVFVDVDPATALLDLAAVEAAIGDKTKAVVPVHLYGQLADMEGIAAIVRSRGIKVVEDACQAHGAMSNGRRAGAFGDAGCFSFYPSKNLGGMGDGGIVVTGDAGIADLVRALRCHGEDSERNHILAGYCSRLHGLQAAVLRVKLGHLDEWNACRREAARWYDDALAGTSPKGRLGARFDDGHVYHLYVVRTEDRDQVQKRLAEQGIGTGVHYRAPLHLEPAYQHLGLGTGEFPVAEELAREILSLPMHPHLTRPEVEEVCGALARCAESPALV